MKERIAVIDGVRTPFCKAGGVFKDWQADDLGAFAVKELLAKIKIPKEKIDELVFGNVLQPPHAANIARVLAVKGGLPIRTPAFTVNRNCASGMEAITSSMNKLRLKEADIIIAGGTESMSHFPILFNKGMRGFIQRMSKARSLMQKLSSLFSFRLGFLKPEIPEIADPLCAMNMGQTAELLARQFHITRQDQDQYALQSQQRASLAQKEGRFAEEIVPIPSMPSFSMQQLDDGIRHETTMEGFSALKPAFEKQTGTVTAGNSSQVTDGACAVLLMRESLALELGLTPIGYIKDYATVALEPSRMGLGPAYAISKLLEKTDKKLEEIDLFEINEAFAAQVIAVERALESQDFSRRELGREEALGAIDREKLNVNGGAIALGHPVGVSGARLVLTLLKELGRRGKKTGVASLCVGGGQGEAVLVEVE